MWFGKLAAFNMTLMGLLGRKTTNQTNKRMALKLILWKDQEKFFLVSEYAFWATEVLF